MHFVDLTIFEKLGDNNSVVHQLDPRGKIIVAACFILAVMSFGKYELLDLLPFIIYPVYLVIIADLPVFFLLKRLLLMSVFAVMVGIWNPFLDHVTVSLGGITISAGWFSFASIIIRFFLTAGVALILIATTGIMPICQGGQRLGVPHIFVSQILFLYRYIFVIGDEASRLMAARELRSFSSSGMRMSVYSKLISSLLGRSLARANRIYIAMKSRGFDGEIRTSYSLKWQLRDTIYLLGWAAVFGIMRFISIPKVLGGLFT